MHPLKVDAMVKEARIIVLVKDGEIWGLAKLKRLPKLSQFQLVLYTLICVSPKCAIFCLSMVKGYGSLLAKLKLI